MIYHPLIPDPSAWDIFNWIVSGLSFILDIGLGLIFLGVLLEIMWKKNTTEKEILSEIPSYISIRTIDIK